MIERSVTISANNLEEKLQQNAMERQKSLQAADKFIVK